MNALFRRNEVTLDSVDEEEHDSGPRVQDRGTASGVGGMTTPTFQNEPIGHEQSAHDLHVRSRRERQEWALDGLLGGFAGLQGGAEALQGLETG